MHSSASSLLLSCLTVEDPVFFSNYTNPETDPNPTIILILTLPCIKITTTSLLGRTTNSWKTRYVLNAWRIFREILESCEVT